MLPVMVDWECGAQRCFFKISQHAKVAVIQQRHEHEFCVLMQERERRQEPVNLQPLQIKFKGSITNIARVFVDFGDPNFDTIL